MWNKFKNWLSYPSESTLAPDYDLGKLSTDWDYSTQLRQQGLQSLGQYQQLQNQYNQMKQWSGSTVNTTPSIFPNPSIGTAFDMAEYAIKSALERMRSYKQIMTYKKMYEQITFKAEPLIQDPYAPSYGTSTGNTGETWYMLNKKYFSGNSTK